MSYYNDDYYEEDSADYYDNDEGSAEEPVDETGYRNTWEILTWIIIALTIVLNLILIGILVFRRNLRSIINKSEYLMTRNNIIDSFCFSNLCGCHQRPHLWMHCVTILCGELCQAGLGEKC